MALMKCPRCGGSGYTIDAWEEGTTVDWTQSTCPSCGGKGYVTDEQIYPLRDDGTSGVEIKWANPIITREPERIDRILGMIRTLWGKFPDWRLAQLLLNVLPELNFGIEDTTLEESLAEFQHKVSDVT